MAASKAGGCRPAQAASPRILFNAEALLFPTLTGVGYYCLHLLRALQDPDLDVSVVPFAHGRPRPDLLMPNPTGPGAAPVAAAHASPSAKHPRLRSLIAQIPGAREFYVALAAMRGRHGVGRIRGDLYHEPNHVLHRFSGPTVLTVHDLSVLRFPQWHPAERVAHFERGFARSIERAAGILTASEVIRQEIISLLGVPENRVHTARLAADPSSRPIPQVGAEPILRRHGLAWDGYVLFVGTREPRKNLDRLLDAWAGLPTELRAQKELVLVGPAGWKQAALEERLDRIGAGVRRLGYVTDSDRSALYSGASAFVYPSLYEGFGLPPLEAAACGVPVLTSLGTSMADVLADAAVLVDPQDVDAIRDGIRRLLEDAPLRATLRRAGLDAAARHTWRRCAEQTVTAYRAVLGKQTVAP